MRHNCSVTQNENRLVLRNTAAQFAVGIVGSLLIITWGVGVVFLILKPTGTHPPLRFSQFLLNQQLSALAAALLFGVPFLLLGVSALFSTLNDRFRPFVFNRADSSLTRGQNVWTTNSILQLRIASDTRDFFSLSATLWLDFDNAKPIRIAQEFKRKGRSLQSAAQSLQPLAAQLSQFLSRPIIIDPSLFSSKPTIAPL